VTTETKLKKSKTCHDKYKKTKQNVRDKRILKFKAHAYA